MKIIWSPTARTKTKEILEYTSEDNPDAALSLIDQFETKVEKLKLNPESGRVLLLLSYSSPRWLTTLRGFLFILA